MIETWLAIIALLLFLIYLQSNKQLQESLGVLVAIILMPALWAGIPSLLIGALFYWLTKNLVFSVFTGSAVGVLILGWMIWNLLIVPWLKSRNEKAPSTPPASGL